ncbi:MAG: amidohydrolase family protein [Actinomycetota bacterium]|nr:amidohydrolase family protein [Actinomycetota bacterium]
MATTVFKDGQVFNGKGLDAADLAIADGRITGVGVGLSGDEVVDCGGKVLLPGLFDCHTHMRFPDVSSLNPEHVSIHSDEDILRFPHTARSVLELGITTVRDAGGASIGIKNALDKGIVVGPRMQTAIAAISMTGGHSDGYEAYGGDLWSIIDYPGIPDPLCDGVDGCIRKTREMIRAGAEVVKFSASGGFLSPNDDPQHPNFLQEEMDAIVRTAADLATPVMAHAHGAEAIKRAVKAGVRSIEHGTFLDEEAAAMMAEAGTWLVATLTSSDGTEAIVNDPGTPESVRQKLATLGTPERGAFQLAVDSGVRIAMGTDCPVAPHGTNLRELVLMSENGLTPVQALVASTSSAAELTGLQEQLGSLETGKIADVVVISGDPYEFDTLKDRVEQVWKDGERVV